MKEEPALAGAEELRPNPAPTTPFSSSRAWDHLEKLSDLGPRPAGSKAAARSRKYFAEQLSKSGLAVSELRIAVEDDGKAERVHVVAELPGESTDLILLVAHYDTRSFEDFDFVGANASASGPAVVLELARSLALQPQLYTHRIALVEGDATVGSDGLPSLAGSRDLAAALAANDELRRIRLAVFYESVGDADLRIARDLRSHRVHREVFWASARSLDFDEAFPSSTGYESPITGHRPFLDRGVRQVVALVDTKFGGDEPPGLFADSPDDVPRRCSEESLGAVGVVSLEGLERISKRLAKIDRFARSPIAFDPALAASRHPAPPARKSGEPAPPAP